MTSSMDLTEFLESPLGLVQAGLMVGVPVVLGALVNIGCGKKREPVRASLAAHGKSKPGGDKKAGVDLSVKDGKSKRSVSAKAKLSGKSRSSKSSKSKKGSSKDKSKKSKRSTKSIDKSGKSGKSKKSGKNDSKSSKSKKSKRDVQQKTGPPSSRAKDGAPTGPKSGQGAQPTSARLAVEAEKRSARQASALAAAGVAHENSAKSAPTQKSVSMKQPSSGAALDANANVVLGPGDSTRELKMEPAELRWSAAGGMQKISLLNQSGERQAVKVKCSDNNVYRVNPVYAIVEPGQALNVDVMRQNGSNKVDKIVFVTTKAGSEENPKNLFKPGTASSMMVLPLLATAPTHQPTVAAMN